MSLNTTERGGSHHYDALTTLCDLPAMREVYTVEYVWCVFTALPLPSSALLVDVRASLMTRYDRRLGGGSNLDLRSKTRTLEGPIRTVDDLPNWNYDGSSTNQAPGTDSEVILVPRKIYRDPFRATAVDKDHVLDRDRKNMSVHNRALYVEHRSLDKPALSPVAEPALTSGTLPEIHDGCRNLLVMCDTYEPSGRPIPSNTRAAANAIFTLPEVSCEEPWFGIEQEYTLLDATSRWPLGWPKGGYPGPQGPYYCGIGADRMFGRNIADAHYRACQYAGLAVSGINAEVMPGQWEFQVGPCVGIDAGDQLWMARYILQRVCELTGDVVVTYDPKPVPGDWNGAGAHCNYSTRSMREKRLGGMNEIERAILLLEDRHAVHIDAYGPGNERRLTGRHETAAMDKFTWGVADRGASVRVGNETASAGAGYLEDRRPSANADPYAVTSLLAETTLATSWRGEHDSSSVDARNVMGGLSEALRSAKLSNAASSLDDDDSSTAEVDQSFKSKSSHAGSGNMYEFGVPITPEKSPPPVSLQEYLTIPSAKKTPAMVDKKGRVHRSPIGDDGSL